MFFDIHVGSTGIHRAHAHTDTVLGIIQTATGNGDVKELHTLGVWEGSYEPTVRYTVELDSDTQAQMLAYAIAIQTRNDSVLVSRLATSRDDSPMNSKRSYLANVITTATGDRTLLSPNTWNGYKYIPNIRGAYVAYLVHSRGTRITPVE